MATEFATMSDDECKGKLCGQESAVMIYRRTHIGELIDGRIAFSMGKTMDDCPWKKGTEYHGKRIAWLVGWCDARTEKKWGRIT